MKTKHFEFILPPCTTNHPSGSDTFVTRKLVPAFNVHTNSIPKFIEIGPSTLLIHPYKFLLPSQKYFHGYQFFLTSHTFLVGLREPQNIIFTISICTYTCLSSNSLISY